MSKTPTASKLSKKVAGLFKDKPPAPKRFKSFRSLVDSTKSEDDLKQMFREFFQNIYDLVFANFQQTQTSPKKGKSYGPDKLGIGVLKQFLSLVPDLATKMPVDNLAKIIEMGLADGFQTVRLASLELLLVYIEVQNNPRLIQLFSTAIPYKILRNPPPSPAPTSPEHPVNSSDVVEMVDLFFKFVNNRINTAFEYWWNLFRTNYMVLFFPTACKQMEVTFEKDEKEAFEKPPPEIVRVMILELEMLSETAPVHEILWTKNSPLMMEIAAKAFSLPITFQDTIHRAIALFRGSFMNTQKNKVFGDQLQEYWQRFIKMLEAVTDIESGADQVDSHGTLCKEVLAIYSYFALEYSSKISAETRKLLQYSLMDTTKHLLARITPKPIQTSLPHSIGDIFVNNLFLIWIRFEAFTTEEMWQDLRASFIPSLGWPCVVNQWREKVIQLTIILKDYFYAVQADKAKDDDLKLKANVLVGSKTVQLRDPKLSGMNWSIQSIKSVWDIMLNILGNFNDIPDSGNFETAMGCLAEVIEILNKSEKDLPTDVSPPLPLKTYFLHWFLTACDPSNKHVSGKLIVYRTLCKQFLIRHNNLIDLQLLSHIYRVLSIGLNSNTSMVINEIMKDSTTIFAMGLPGVSVLVGDYLKEINAMFAPENKNRPPEDVQSCAITILNSIICYPNHFEGLEYPSDHDKPEEKLATETLREMIAMGLISALRRTSSTANQIQCLYGLCVFVFEELLSPNPRLKIVTEVMESVMQCARFSSQDTSVAETAVIIASAWSYAYPKLAPLAPSIVSHIVSVLCDTVIHQIKGNLKDHLVMDMYYCLLDWLTCSDTKLPIFNDEAILAKVFQAIEYGIFGELVTPGAQVPVELAPPPPATPGRASPTPAATAASSPNRSSSGNSSSAKATAVGFLVEKLHEAPLHKSAAVQECAEAVLLALANHYCNTPSLAGPEQENSNVSEPEGTTDPVLTFSHAANTIISLHQAEAPNGPLARVIVRDMSGRYCWDNKLLYDANENKKDHTAKANFELPITERAPPKPAPPPVISTREEGELPLFSAEPTNKVMDLLHYLSEACPETLPSGGKHHFFEPLEASPSYETHIETLIDDLHEQARQESAKPDDNEREALVLEAPVAEPINPFHYCRLLLSHLGYLTPENRKKLHFMDNSVRTKRSIKELDKVWGREVIKIGLIYVQNDQTTEGDILKNNSASALYHEFVKGLGWSVDLESHPGFMGGLDRRMTTGTTAPYYSDHSVEVVFHDITRMPTNPTDPLQITKKRHVGNDIVQIVWSEHNEDYKPLTIKSKFNDGHVVIYPLPNGLFRIQIMKKEKVGAFGPLLNNMCVNKRILAPLVRLTAMNATRAVRYTTKGYKRPYPTRRDFIKESISRYKEEKPFSIFFKEFYPFHVTPTTPITIPNDESSDALSEEVLL